jgi:hypothetical protein
MDREEIVNILILETMPCPKLEKGLKWDHNIHPLKRFLIRSPIRIPPLEKRAHWFMKPRKKRKWLE